MGHQTLYRPIYSSTGYQAMLRIRDINIMDVYRGIITNEQGNPSNFFELCRIRISYIIKAYRHIIHRISKNWASFITHSKNQYQHQVIIVEAVEAGSQCSQ